MNVGAQQLAPTDYEVSIALDAKAGEGADLLFKLDMEYTGVFRLVNIPAERNNGHPAFRGGTMDTQLLAIAMGAPALITTAQTAAQLPQKESAEQWTPSFSEQWTEQWMDGTMDTQF